MLLTRHTAGQEETEMDSDYMFLCGVMWCRFGQPEAGKELVRAATSMDPDMRALAWRTVLFALELWKEQHTLVLARILGEIGSARTMDFNANDIGFVPANAGHC
jgi:hypothetical protein